MVRDMFAYINGLIRCTASQRIVYRYNGNTLELGGEGDELDTFFSEQESLLGG